MIDEVLKEIQQGALFVINHSGGKDSQAMMIKLLEFIPKEQILVAHASLGDMEWHGALELAQQQALDAGVPFLVARSWKSLIDMTINRFDVRPEVPSFPSSSNRQCTSDLKRDPIKREVRRFAKAKGFTRIVNCMGLRAQESSNRAKKEVWKINKSEHGRAGRSWHEWLPIHGLTTGEVFQTIKDVGQQPHYAYTQGNERLSCVFCIMASGNDLMHGVHKRPELYALYCMIEKVTGYSMHQSMKTLPEITGIQPDFSLLKFSNYQEIVAKAAAIRSKRKLINVLEIAA
ncbi:phosphoadenosine phosphosulfate reductase domain-containing protein [Acinetobacter colistiniresistens]|uniref:phosphoadenosine phosphosulfate reductase domain-containing protein n=1 Tax=Acinetobacter colistiniresistens TaxID=280145 RepID=UPI0012505E53|nr:phosphoadenosine phosphosulfate reductase family protein [Acinetobacter colistiniresistens]